MYLNIRTLLRRINFYAICFVFGFSVLLILTGRNIKNIKIEDAPIAADEGTERILEQTRMKIVSELVNYNFTQSGVHNLKDLLMESGGRPLRSIIMSSWRSGTTFLGEVLNAIPGSFYHYEPLLYYDIIQIRGPPHAETALNLVKKMLKCNFDGMYKYFQFGRNNLHQFNHNTRLWDHCKFKNDLCFDANFTGSFCKLFPFQNMKIVRLRLRLMKEILEDKELNVKVILLVRDPRGVMQSRLHRNFCQRGPDCWKPDLLCADMISDYVAASRLLPKYADRFMVLRYEDLALDSRNVTHQLYKFLGMSVTSSVEDFLNSHTNMEAGGVSSTYRVSREVPFKWKNILDYKYVEDVQSVCKEAMSLWGYRVAHNASQLASNEFFPIQPYTISL